MLWLTIILALGLAGALAWGLRLRGQLRAIQYGDQPTARPFTPVVQAVAATIDTGLVVIGRDLEVSYLNPQAEQLLGVEPSGAVGQGLIAVIRDYQAESLVKDVLSDNEAREMTLQSLTGGRTLRLRAAPFAVDDTGGVVLLVRDVTQISMLERARRDMVANVSHELRTPLASMKLLVETLQSPPPPHVAQRMLVQMAQEVDAITQLVDELHELSQIESGRVALQLSPASLTPVATRAIERIRPQAERKALHISASVPDQLPPALIDADRIGQVLLNLMHNAIKFTPSGGEIALRAFLITIGDSGQQIGYVERRLSEHGPANGHERRQSAPPLHQQGRPSLPVPQPLTPGEWIIVMIADNGIGIPARDLPRIFERFYKVDRARTRNAGGTGLGLAIAKHLIEGHGGRIWAVSEEGSGSTFYFALPVA
ncbi:MAG TPA: ATP-binding protein [Roseiflexaceae bacterium]|nr:ATP-binding protein [Roseiflexaceae bacterium]